MTRWRRVSVEPAAGLNATLNIAPLTDVSLSLLVTFIVVSPLLMPESTFLHVPGECGGPDGTSVTAVNVRLLRTGEVQLNDHPIAIEELSGRLQALLAPYNRDERDVGVIPDDEANYGRFLSVVDLIKGAGARIIMRTGPPQPD